jgi:large subunit ribosomal protein L17
MIELVDFNEIYGKGVADAAAPAKKTRRSAGRSKKKAEGEQTEESQSPEASAE